MKAHIITIGNEILIGQIIDSNSAYIGQKLTELGIKVEKISSIADDKKAILDILTHSHAHIHFITGGLGPTQDDITKKTISEFFQSEIIINKDILAHIEHLVKVIFKKEMNELNVEQAMIPKIAIPLFNKVGTAPGMWIEKNNKLYICMPGVPYEMKNMIIEEVIPKLKSQFNLPYIIQKHLLVLNIPESELAILLNDWETQLPKNISIAYLTNASRVKLCLTATGNNKVELDNILNKEIEILKPILDQHLISITEEKVEELIGKVLMDKEFTISLAESCTGGNIAKIITSISGSSQYFIGSVVSYATRIKEKFLQVSKESVRIHTAVSEKVAIEMAKGIQRKFNTQVALSITGVAGPNKGEYEKEIGTTWVAVVINKAVFTQKFYYPNLTREDFIEKVSLKALDFLYVKLGVK